MPITRVPGFSPQKSIVGRRPRTRDRRQVYGLPRDTSVAKLSLDPGVTPATRTNHVFHFTARSIDSRQGTIRVDDYGGTSTYLETPTLTTSFVTYDLPIPDANAALISDYTALEVWFWGHSVLGEPVTFQIAEIFLTTPEGAIAVAVTKFPYTGGGYYPN